MEPWEQILEKLRISIGLLESPFTKILIIYIEE